MVPILRDAAQERGPQDDGGVWLSSALDLRRRQLHRLAAAASADLVGVVEDELGLHLVGLVVHLGAEQEQYGLGVDQNLDALVLHHFVGRLHIVGVFHRVGLPGTAAILDA